MTANDYVRAKSVCIEATNDAKYSEKFRYTPGVAPKDAPRTSARSAYAACMEAKGFVCLNCKRAYRLQPDTTGAKQTLPDNKTSPEDTEE
jgi:hypothetical protein